MPGLRLLLLVFLTGCTARTPAIHMRFVDEVDNTPVAGAQASFCATAWGGTLTGHGGASDILFEVIAATDAQGELNLAPQEFEARPFGMNTNYDHAQLLVVKPGYEPKKIVNWGAALGEYAAVSKWAYNGMTIALKRAPADAVKAPPRYGFGRQCGESLLPPAPLPAAAMPPSLPPRPAAAPQDAESRNRRAAQPAR